MISNKKNTCKIKWLIFIFTLCSNPLFSQESIDLFKATQHISQGQNESNNTKANINFTAIQLLAPAKFPDSSILAFSPSWNSLNLKYGVVGQTDYAVFGASLGISYKKTLSEKWITTLSFTPSIHSDFSDISTKDVKWKESILFSRNTTRFFKDETGLSLES